MTGKMPKTAAGPRSAVFLDRDGTVSEEVGYLYDSSMYRIFPWTGAGNTTAQREGPACDPGNQPVGYRARLLH